MRTLSSIFAVCFVALAGCGEGHGDQVARDLATKVIAGTGTADESRKLSELGATGITAILDQLAPNDDDVKKNRAQMFLQGQDRLLSQSVVSKRLDSPDPDAA